MSFEHLGFVHVHCDSSKDNNSLQPFPNTLTLWRFFSVPPKHITLGYVPNPLAYPASFFRISTLLLLPAPPPDNLMQTLSLNCTVLFLCSRSDLSPLTPLLSSRLCVCAEVASLSGVCRNLF